MKYFTSDILLSDTVMSNNIPINAIIDIWNNTVTHDDEVYILGGIGDFSKLKNLNGSKIILMNQNDMGTYHKYITSVSSKRDVMLDKEMFRVYCKNEYGVNTILFRDTLEVTLFSGDIVRLCVDYPNSNTSKLFTIASGMGVIQRVFDSGVNVTSCVNGFRPVSEYDVLSFMRRDCHELYY